MITSNLIKRALYVYVGIILFNCGYTIILSADELSDRIQQIQADIERTQKELEEGEKKLEQLKSKEQNGLAELSLIENNIESVKSNLASIRNEERSLTKRIETVQASYDSVKTGLEQHVSRYADRLISIYKRQQLSPLSSVANVGSMTEIMRGFSMLKSVAMSDLELVNELREKSNALQESSTQLRQSLDAKRKLANAKQEEQVTLQNSRKKKQQIIAEVKRDEEKLEALNTQNRQDIKDSQAKVDLYLRERERSNTSVDAALRSYDFTAYKGKLSWPVTGNVVSSFGRNVDPRTKTVTNNRGIEIETSENEPVMSIGRGEVVMTQYLRGYGNLIIIQHPPNYYSVYGHLTDILATPGDIVNEGEIIGIAGNTGMIDESAPRLVLEILKVDVPENPLTWLSKDSRQAKKK